MEPRPSERWSKAASAGKSRQWVKLCRHDGMRQESPWERVRQWVLILALNQWGYGIVCWASGWRNILMQHLLHRKCSGVIGQCGCPNLPLSLAWSAYVAVISQELALNLGACEVCLFITVL